MTSMPDPSEGELGAPASPPRQSCGEVHPDCDIFHPEGHPPRSSTEGRSEHEVWEAGAERVWWNVGLACGWLTDPNPFPRFHLFRLFWKGRKNA